MKERTVKNLIFAASVACVLVGAMLVPSSCANTTEAPTGGLKDTIPPYIVNIVPPPGTVGVPLSGAKFYFEFNEYVTIKQSRNIFLSPPQSKSVKSKVKGKGIVVSFEEDLLPETTYTISFVDAVADNNEGNMFAGYTYAFSTSEHIDSMLVTGTVLDCNTLNPVKGATVLLYKDHADSAIFLHRPYAAAKTDDWGYFCLPYIQDTLYRLYALKDESGNNVYDPDNDLVGFVDSLVRPVMVAYDTIPEMLKYDMLDTIACTARKSEYEIDLFREKPSRQFVKNYERTGDYSAYVSFQAPNVWIDSLWIKGYEAPELITEFDILQDSLQIWLNKQGRIPPDTLHLFVNYRKTDSLGHPEPFLEHLKVFQEGVGGRKKGYAAKKDLKKEDTTCVYKLSAAPETVEQNGFELEFTLPVVNARFDSLKFRYLNPKQKEFKGELTVEKDTLNLRRYILRPKLKLQSGYEYFVKVPAGTFRDIRGFWCDSTEVKVTLPTDESLSTFSLELSGVDRKIIVDLLGEKRDKVLRSYVVSSSCTLSFPYLKSGKYSIRITDDGNRNSIVDTGSLLEHRLPEKVRFVLFNDKNYIEIPPSAEVSQRADVQEIFKKK